MHIIIAKIHAAGDDTQIIKKLLKYTARMPAPLLPMISITDAASALAL